MNKIMITGNLTRDPEMRQTANGVPYCNFTVAVNRKGRDDEKVADFYSVTAWRGLGETINKFFKKGSKIFVMGDISLRNVEKEDGVKKLYIDVTATDFEFMDGNRRDNQYAPQEPTPVQQPQPIKINTIKPPNNNGPGGIEGLF